MKKMIPLGAVLFGMALMAILMMTSVKCAANPNAKSCVEVGRFGVIASGEKRDLYVLTNSRGIAVGITNYGATVLSHKVPDRTGKFADGVLGYDNAKEYQDGTAHFGGSVGRYANRIAHGSFTLAGKTYTLPKNNGENTLHGGLLSFDKKMRAAKEVPSKEGAAVEFTYVSPDTEEGSPWTSTATVGVTCLNPKNDFR